MSSNGLCIYSCRFAVNCSYAGAGVGNFESSTSTIDVVADVKSEKVSAVLHTSHYFDNFDTFHFWVLFANTFLLKPVPLMCWLSMDHGEEDRINENDREHIDTHTTEC